MSMRDRSLLQRWAENPSFLDDIRRWTWFRTELPPVIAGARWPADRIDRAALAKAFLQWASLIDAATGFEPIDREDFAHFAAGSLLHHWLRAGPALIPGTARDARFEALTRAALAVLDAWRARIGADAVIDDVPAPGSPRWNSYAENCLEDAALAVAFLDTFTGRQSVWDAPLAIELRPAMRRGRASAAPAGAAQPPA